MSNRVVNFPYLKTYFLTKYNSIIEDAFHQTRKYSLCWLAFEELEALFPDHKLNETISFKINDGNIVFEEIANHNSLATIYYNPALINIDKDESGNNIRNGLFEFVSEKEVKRRNLAW